MADIVKEARDKNVSVTKWEDENKRVSYSVSIGYTKRADPGKWLNKRLTLFEPELKRLLPLLEQILN